MPSGGSWHSLRISLAMAIVMPGEMFSVSARRASLERSVAARAAGAAGHAVARRVLSDVDMAELLGRVRLQ